MTSSPQLFKHWARELSAQIKSVFTSCLSENKWPSVWKEACVVPIHKKNSLSNVLEKIVTAAMCKHLSDNHVLLERQFGLRSDRSTTDLLLLLKDWQDALEEGLDTQGL